MPQSSVRPADPAPQLAFAENAWPAPSEIHALMRDYGAVHLRGFYREDPSFLAYVDELTWCAGALMEEAGLPVPANADLETRLSLLFAHDQSLPRWLYLLGAQPIQIASGAVWRYSPRTMAMARAVFGDSARLGVPVASDHLLGHHAAEGFERYLLPVHEDYPYLLQSEAMVTFWVPVGPPAPGLGGLSVWPGSHHAGPRPVRVNEHGHLESIIAPGEAYPELTIEDWAFGDLVLLDGAILHRGHHNHSRNRIRLVQIFRFTDLNRPIARQTHWQSHTFPRPSLAYEDALPLFEARRGAAPAE